MPRYYLAFFHSLLLFSLLSDDFHCSVVQVVPEPAAENDVMYCCTIFCRIEQPATFGSGASDWQQYLADSIEYPDVAYRNHTEGTIKVTFTILENGTVAKVKPLNELKDGLTEAAVSVIRASPKWNPAMQKGHPIQWRSVQHITFKIEETDTPSCDTLPENPIHIS